MCKQLWSINLVSDQFFVFIRSCTTTLWVYYTLSNICKLYVPPHSMLSARSPKWLEINYIYFCFRIGSGEVAYLRPPPRLRWKWINMMCRHRDIWRPAKCCVGGNEISRDRVKFRFFWMLNRMRQIAGRVINGEPRGMIGSLLNRRIYL